MPSASVVHCSEVLQGHGLTIAFAESVTAGRLASEFSLTKNSGSILKGGIVCYDAEVKESVLGIAPDFIREFTPESAEVTKELALRLKKVIKSDVQVAVTGLTTPGGSETQEKPVGTIFVHVYIRDISIAVRRVYEGMPEQIVVAAADLAASTITHELNQGSL
jgi:nicotinamide-nucleotide amidase